MQLLGTSAHSLQHHTTTPMVEAFRPLEQLPKASWIEIYSDAFEEDWTQVDEWLLESYKFHLENRAESLELIMESCSFLGGFVFLGLNEADDSPSLVLISQVFRYSTTAVRSWTPPLPSQCNWRQVSLRTTYAIGESLFGWPAAENLQTDCCVGEKFGLLSRPNFVCLAMKDFVEFTITN